MGPRRTRTDQDVTAARDASAAGRDISSTTTATAAGNTFNFANGNARVGVQAANISGGLVINGGIDLGSLAQDPGESQ